MEVIHELPPNWEDINKVYSPDKNRVVVTYGDKLYNPGKNPIDYYLLQHELTHSTQQKEIGVENWWTQYLHNKSFMLEQEVEAYRKQYKTFCQEHTSKKFRKEFLEQLATDLSSPTYAETVTKEEAIELIKQ